MQSCTPSLVGDSCWAPLGYRMALLGCNHKQVPLNTVGFYFWMEIKKLFKAQPVLVWHLPGFPSIRVKRMGKNVGNSLSEFQMIQHIRLQRNCSSYLNFLEVGHFRDDIYCTGSLLFQVSFTHYFLQYSDEYHMFLVIHCSLLSQVNSSTETSPFSLSLFLKAKHWHPTVCALVTIILRNIYNEHRCNKRSLLLSYHSDCLLS